MIGAECGATAYSRNEWSWNGRAKRNWPEHRRQLRAISGPMHRSYSHLIRSPRSARESSAGGMFRLSALAVLRLMTSPKFRRLLDRKVRRLCDFEDLQLPWPSTTPGCEPAALPLTVPRYWASSSIWSAGI